MTEEFRRTGRDQVSIRDIDGTGNLKVFVTTPGEVTSEHTGEPQGAKKIVIPGAICPKGAGNRRWQPDQKLAGWLAKIVRQTDGRDTDGRDTDGWASPERAAQHIEGLLVYHCSRRPRP